VLRAKEDRVKLGTDKRIIILISAVQIAQKKCDVLPLSLKDEDKWDTLTRCPKIWSGC
jgi:hypothetical protein